MAFETKTSLTGGEILQEAIQQGGEVYVERDYREIRSNVVGDFAYGHC